MHVVLWDTRTAGVTKDFAGGFGVGRFAGRAGIGAAIIRAAFRRDRRPVALAYAHLAAIFRELGHTVEYAAERVPPSADLYVFHPSLPTLPHERQAMRKALQRSPGCRVLVLGIVAHTLPEAFDGLDVTLVQGEPEQLLWKLDEVLSSGQRVCDVGRVEDLDALPLPDWSPFAPRQFRIGYDFSRFPTALVQASRGCALKCDYCPYIVIENTTRFRDPQRVVAEIAAGIARHGFRSFKFRDPLFGLNRRHTLELAAELARLPRPIQFSIESRIDLLPDEVLQALRAVGLTSVTFGVETPDEAMLREHQRKPISDDRQRAFIDECRRLAIRSVAGFMIGFPDDTQAHVARVLDYARRLNPTFANFNIVTPYPGTAFFGQVRERIATFDYSQYDVYTPVLQYRHLTAAELARLHAACFTKYYFRSRWLFANAPVLWPRRRGAAGQSVALPDQVPQEDDQRRGADDGRKHRDPKRRQQAA